MAHLPMAAIHELTERRPPVSAMTNGGKLVTAEALERHPEAQSEEELKSWKAKRTSYSVSFT